MSLLFVFEATVLAAICRFFGNWVRGIYEKLHWWWPMPLHISCKRG